MHEAVQVVNVGSLSRDGLTDRQYAIVRERALGRTFKATSMALGISVSTAKRELRAVHEKLGATCDADIWRDLGWLVVP